MFTLPFMTQGTTTSVGFFPTYFPRQSLRDHMSKDMIPSLTDLMEVLGDIEIHMSTGNTGTQGVDT